MIHRIEIKNRKPYKEGRCASIVKMIGEDLKIDVADITIVRAYNLFGEFSESELLKIKEELFCDAICQDGVLGFAFAKELRYDFAVEISYKSGVTDNVGRTASRGISDILGRHIEDKWVKPSTLYLFKADLKKEQIDFIATNLLCNTLIEDYFIFSREEVLNGSYPIYTLPVETTLEKPFYNVIDLDVSDDKLVKISNNGLLSLDLSEMKAIRDYYKREDISKDRLKNGLPPMPTDVELEVFAQTWSEHCKHKIFAATINYNDGEKVTKIESLFKTFIKGSTDIIKQNRDDLLSLFKDNAGVVKLDSEYAYCVKAETHNSPSALDPYGGAMTGIVGVNRDIIGTGIGAYPIFNTDIFCFGDPFIDEKDIPEGLLHPRRIFRGVHRGVKDGGNESGIPTVNGAIVFDNGYLGKPLVFCGTGGLLPLKINGKKSYEKYTSKGDLIVVSGGRTGKDGIHGATFSSAHLTESSPTSAVQIGDPITQKKLLDFIIEARDLGLYSGLTDNGAGGLSSSVGEMALFTNGATLYLDKCPLKYTGLKPWEILVSEAQERMTLSVSKEKIDEFLNLSKKRDVESTVIGEFNDSGYFSTYYNDVVVSKIDMDMLHNGCPKMFLHAEWLEPTESRLELIADNYKESLRELLKSYNIASKEHWVRMYDHEVQGRTINKPFTGKDNDGPSDGGVLKIFKDKDIGLVITNGITPRYSKIDTYHMTANVIDEAVRQAIILGANPDKLVGLDNFCWPDPVVSTHTPDGKYKLAQLVRSCQALFDTTIHYNTPCISGKDSMKNDYRKGNKKISVLPTLLFTVTGIIDDVSKMTSFYFKTPNDIIYLIGETKPHLGASEYYNIKNISGGLVPKVDTKEAMASYKKIHLCIKSGVIKSAHDLSDGGLAVALSEAAFSGDVGCEIDLTVMDGMATQTPTYNLTIEEKLFSETPSRILVSIDPKNEKSFLEIMRDVKLYKLGQTTSQKRLIVKNSNQTIIEDSIEELKSIWKNSLVF